jgi:hypothetical protein
MKKIVTLVLCVLFSSSILMAQDENTSLIDKYEDRFKTEEFNVIMLLQSTADFSFKEDDFIGGRQFGMGANLLDVKGSLPNNFSYRLQLQLNRTPAVLDGQVGYRFSDQFRVIAGSSKPALSVDLDPSPASTDMINRARLVGAMLNAREIGVAFLGDFDGFYYRAGMYNGNGLNPDNDNRFLYTLRLGHKMDLNSDQKLNFGINTSLNRTQSEFVGNSVMISAGDRVLYGFYLIYDSDTIFGTVEFLESKFELEGSGLDETITGFYATLGNQITEQNQIVLRWDHLSYGISQIPASDQIILGLNRQLTELVSLQFNGLYQINDGVEDQLGMSANFQFYF